MTGGELGWAGRSGVVGFLGGEVVDEEIMGDLGWEVVLYVCGGVVKLVGSLDCSLFGGVERESSLEKRKVAVSVPIEFEGGRRVVCGQCGLERSSGHSFYRRPRRGSGGQLASSRRSTATREVVSMGRHSGGGRGRCRAACRYKGTTRRGQGGALLRCAYRRGGRRRTVVGEEADVAVCP